ncbi:DUF229 domain containing protein [Nitzschia inconspicua]|uniref:DUF229 domain containing protein n=1 Tax=Nitzschia inconspicua TaxID=303405 RepID=A0A9K3KUJ0_9STRA|nr:DUF229 domain containing protein [Nitzschia inconspicua]
MQPRTILFWLFPCYISTTFWLLLLSDRDDSATKKLPAQVVHRSLRNGSISLTVSLQQRPKQNWEPYEQVIQQFSERILSRHITSSNVLVVSPDADIALEIAKGAIINITTTKTQYSMKSLSMGSRLLLDASKEGHDIHAIVNNKRRTTSLHEWWESFDIASSDAQEKPSWILLAVFDSPPWEEDHMWENSSEFLQQATVTYIVNAFHSSKESDGKYRFGGLLAAERLLERRYKLQTLFLSHYQVELPEGKENLRKFGPNALFQSLEAIKDLLRWGADNARMYDSEHATFTAYLFATQGLDLAIPRPELYLIDGATPVNPMEIVRKQDLLSLKQCSPSNDRSLLHLRFQGASLIVEQREKNNTTHLFSLSATVQDPLPDKEFLVWMDGNNPALSEAACVKKVQTGMSKCTTRITPSTTFASPETEGFPNIERPNLLILLLDPISRSHFERTMPYSKEAVRQLNFTSFKKYIAVGPNSGPNQSALYAGTALRNRNGIRSMSNRTIWLWDQLKQAGYATLKGEDGCIENSNMIQSISPNTTHGKALEGLFCFDSFSRPNCIGPDAAGSILLSYGKKFIQSYEKLRKTKHEMLRWASFLHFTDSHEDTMMLASTIDKNIATFLNQIRHQEIFQNTVVVICSDHGLHYGPSFQTLQGRKEATQPMMHVRIPDRMQTQPIMEIFQRNANKYVTAFDIHRTLQELTFLPPLTDGPIGLSLISPLPESRELCNSTNGIVPSHFCSLQNQ